MEPRANTGRRRARRAGVDVPGFRAVHAAGRNRGPACGGAELCGNRLAADRRALRPPAPRRPVSGDRVAPRCRGRDARRPGARARAHRCDSRARRARGVSPRPRRSGGSVTAAGSKGRGCGGIQAGPGVGGRGAGAASHRAANQGPMKTIVTFSAPRLRLSRRALVPCRMRAISFTALVASALLLASCRSDNPLDAPPLQADAQCNDDPLLCGPVDGTIHDGTGDGSVTQVAGDPSPGAPGIWLGWYGSGQYCYANYNSFMNDGDHDWLDDQCEYLIAKAFAPALAISPADGYDKGEPYWAVKYFPNDPNYGWGEFVRIAYMPAYYRDGGTPGSGATAHVGDSEFIMVGVQYNPSTQHW